MHFSPITLNLTELNTNLDLVKWESHESLGRSGTRIAYLYKCQQTGQHVALVHCEAGAYADGHIHLGHESMLVLEGSLEDEWGSYGKGQLVVYPPNSQHKWHCPHGALIYVVWGGRVISNRERNIAAPSDMGPIQSRDIYNFRHLI